MPLTVVVQYYKLMNKIVKNHRNRGQGIIVTPVTLFKFYTIFQGCFLQRMRKSDVNLGKWKGAKLQRNIIIYTQAYLDDLKSNDWTTSTMWSTSLSCHLYLIREDNFETPQNFI